MRLHAPASPYAALTHYRHMPADIHVISVFYIGKKSAQLLFVLTFDGGICRLMLFSAYRVMFLSFSSGIIFGIHLAGSRKYLHMVIGFG